MNRWALITFLLLAVVLTGVIALRLPPSPGALSGQVAGSSSSAAMNCADASFTIGFTCAALAGDINGDRPDAEQWQAFLSCCTPVCNACDQPACGNGITENNVDCDCRCAAIARAKGIPGGPANVPLEATCYSPAEQCDDGNQVNELNGGCSNNCQNLCGEATCGGSCAAQVAFSKCTGSGPAGACQCDCANQGEIEVRDGQGNLVSCACPTNMTHEDGVGNCVCGSGLVDDGNGNCKCPGSLTAQCQCPEGTFESQDGTCTCQNGEPGNIGWCTGLDGSSSAVNSSAMSTSSQGSGDIQGGPGGSSSSSSTSSSSSSSGGSSASSSIATSSSDGSTSSSGGTSTSGSTSGGTSSGGTSGSTSSGSSSGSSSSGSSSSGSSSSGSSSSSSTSSSSSSSSNSSSSSSGSSSSSSSSSASGGSSGSSSSSSGSSSSGSASGSSSGSSSSGSSSNSSSSSSSSSGARSSSSRPIVAFCGDFIVNQSYEQCDDGNTNANYPNRCRTNCQNPRCGDGIVDSGEECDAGTKPSVWCTRDCTRIVATASQPSTAGTSYCGDGTVQAGELCDDGLRNSDTPDRCRTSCTVARCGDKIVDAGEQCDDGNYVAIDACTNDCMFLVVTSGPLCGDGIVEGDEACDDGNAVNGDGCSSTCLREAAPEVLPACGNGLLEAGEQCDDGNTRSADGCHGDCTREYLGGGDIGVLGVPGGSHGGNGGIGMADDGSVPGTNGPPGSSARGYDDASSYGALPYGTVVPVAHAQPATGPGFVIFLASGAAAGIGVLRRRFRR